jgi:antitoxin VapB
MSLTIRDLETERLADEVAELTRDTKTGAVRQALRAERDRLRRGERDRPRQRPEPAGAWLFVPVWPAPPTPGRWDS